MPTLFDSDPGEIVVRRVLGARREPRSLRFSPALFAATFLLALGCASCGAVGSAPPTPLPVTITVTPVSAQPYQGETVQFHVVVQNAANPAIEWQVNGSNGGNPQFGTIDSNGLYTAPATVPNPPTVKVIAALQSDATQMGSSSVTVLNLSSITGTLILSPALTSATASQTVQFHVLTPGVTDTDVTWRATGGTITSDGKYSPPTAPGPYTVVATLIANSNTRGSATVEVTDFAGTLTWRNDNARSGVNNRELALTPGNVNSSKFGKLFSCPIDGYAYAQPLYVPNLTITGKGTHNVVIVATEKDLVYAFDADDTSCNQLWESPPLFPSGSEPIETPNLQITNPDIVPFVGISGTPVIDRNISAVYVVAAAQTIAPMPQTFTPGYSELLYALDLGTGQPEIQPMGVAFLVQPVLESQRAALLLDNRTVYFALGSYGGQGDYHGWLFGYDSTTLHQTGAFNVTPTARQGGIEQSGGGPSADSKHNVYVETGDGPFDVNRGGTSYSDSFLRFDTSQGLSVSGYFTPFDLATLSNTGQNGATSAPLLLPDSTFPTLPHLMIGGSKNGCLYVVNIDDMGGSNSACSQSTPPVQIVDVGDGPILGTPLFWNGSVYVAAANGRLKSFSLTAGTTFSPSPTMQSQETLGPQGATPVISSNGTNNAILWLIDTSGTLDTPNSPAILRAYDPNNLSTEIYSSPADATSPNAAGPAVKFTVPTVANGKVYVGTQTRLDVYGYLH
jgi:hypothetical protein